MPYPRCSQVDEEYWKQMWKIQQDFHEMSSEEVQGKTWQFPQKNKTHENKETKRDKETGVDHMAQAKYVYST